MDGTCDDHHSLCLWKYENPAPCSGAVIRTHRTQEQNGCTSKRTEQGRKSPAANVGFNVSSSTRTFKRHLTILLLTASFLQKFPLHHQGPNRAHSPHLTIPKAAASDDYPFRTRERQSSVGQLHPIAIDLCLIAQPLPRHGFD
jgi:hypothetical protein